MKWLLYIVSFLYPSEIIARLALFSTDNFFKEIREKDKGGASF